MTNKGNIDFNIIKTMYEHLVTCVNEYCAIGRYSGQKLQN